MSICQSCGLSFASYHVPCHVCGITASIGVRLGVEELSAAINNMTNERQPTVLVAPNEATARRWRKDYPGIEVVLEADYRGYDLPSDYRASLVVHADLRQTVSDAGNGPALS